MKKKILIFSIIAVVILTLLSFTSVVGFQNLKSNIKTESPLFSIRTNKVINKDDKELTFDYLGKGKEINILLPIRNKQEILLQQFVELITKMSDEEFEDLIQIIINKIPIEKLDYDEEYFVDELYKFREINLENDGNIIYDIGDYNRQQDYTDSNWITACNPFPFCIPINTIVLLVVVPILLIFLYAVYVITSLFDCHGTYTFLGALCN